ncbi:Hypothetical protein HVR_LOCUS1339 [uncultured virus]|nr:Hypothetical protein HVR_LOCUS1339 [uncultured virus]
MQRGPATPETFQGLYAPVYAADALYYFLTTNPQGFGTMDPTDNNNTQLLMDNLPMAQQGYMLINSINLLFFIYVYYNHLHYPTDPQVVIPDDTMNQAFGDIIPAALYPYRGTNGKINISTMREAIERGLIVAPLNTYDAISQQYAQFDRNRIATYYLQNLAALNYFRETRLGAEPTLGPVLEAIQRPDVREAMLREHAIIRQISQLWQATLEPERRAQREARRAQRQAEQQTQRQQNVFPPIQIPTVNPTPTFQLPTVQIPTVNPTPTFQLPTVNPITTPTMPTIPGTQTTIPVPKVTIPPWVTQDKK